MRQWNLEYAKRELGAEYDLNAQINTILKENFSKQEREFLLDIYSWVDYDLDVFDPKEVFEYRANWDGTTPYKIINNEIGCNHGDTNKILRNCYENYNDIFGNQSDNYNEVLDIVSEEFKKLNKKLHEKINESIYKFEKTQEEKEELMCKYKENLEDVISYLSSENQSFLNKIMQDNEKALNFRIEEFTDQDLNGYSNIKIVADLINGEEISVNIEIVDYNVNDFINEMRKNIKQYENENPEPNFFDGDKGISFFLKTMPIEDLELIDNEVSSQEQTNIKIHRR